MADRVRELLNRILEWWNKFSARQKTFIIAATAGVIVAIAVLMTLLLQPTYILLLNAETTREASEVVDLLESENIQYKVSDDGLQIRVNKKQQSNASLLLGANNIQAYTYTMDNVTSGGFSTTESDKQKRYELYMETRLADDMIGKYSSVKSAVVDLTVPENNGTLLSSDQDTSVWIVLELADDEFTTDTAAALAKGVSVAVGNKTEESIVITDTKGNMLFAGDTTYSASGTASSQLSVKTQWENTVKSGVRQVLLGTNEFDKIEVASNLDLSFSTSKTTDHEYYVSGDNSEGYLSQERTYSSNNVNDGGGLPGTDSNNETIEYEYRDYTSSSSSVEEEERKYLPSERITETEGLPGAINYSSSTIAVTGIRFNIIREEDVRAQGLLDGGITWEEYKLNHAEGERIAVDDDMYEVVAKATGFPRENIAFVARTENVFIDREGLNISTSDVIQVVLIIIILALLAFVVLRSMRADKTAEQPEELSVETLLQSQPEVAIEDIGTEKLSETRMMIEKFVDENPELAANLLRNWLNQGWE